MDNEVVARAAGPIIVVLVGCTGLLGDILKRAVTSSPVIDVRGSVASVTDLQLDQIANADVLLWNDADEHALTDWLTHCASARCPRVLGTTGDGRHASLWELAPVRTELGALSPDEVVEAITGVRGGRSS